MSEHDIISSEWNNVDSAAAHLSSSDENRANTHADSTGAKMFLTTALLVLLSELSD